MASVHERRALKKVTGGNLTARDITMVKQSFPYCLRCGETDRLEIDHVVPLARGGRNELGNMQILCRLCNASKGAKTTDYRELAYFNLSFFQLTAALVIVSMLAFMAGALFYMELGKYDN